MTSYYSGTKNGTVDLSLVTYVSVIKILHHFRNTLYIPMSFMAYLRHIFFVFRFESYVKLSQYQ